MGKNTGKSLSKNLSDKYGKKCFDHARKSTADALKTTSKKVIQKQQKWPVIWLVLKL